MKNDRFVTVSTGFIGLGIQRVGGLFGGFPVYKSAGKQLVFEIWVCSVSWWKSASLVAIRQRHGVVECLNPVS
jgi:hypothetical protein